MPIDHLPPRLRSPAERIRAFLITDAGVMIILGISMMARGLSYLSLGQHVLVNPIDTHIPIYLLSVWWTGIGGALILTSWWQASLASRILLMIGVSTLAAWGSLFIFAPPAAFSQRGIIYIALAAVVVWSVWRGRRGEIRMREGT